MRLREPAEEDAQHRVGVGGGADRRARVGPHPLLVDADRSRQPLEHVDLGPRRRRHEALHEGAVGLVDKPLRLRGDGAEHERALARAGDAREHRQPTLRDLDADVLEVVHARAVHADQVVAVGGAADDCVSVVVAMPARLEFAAPRKPGPARPANLRHEVVLSAWAAQRQRRRARPAAWRARRRPGLEAPRARVVFPRARGRVRRCRACAGALETVHLGRRAEGVGISHTSTLHEAFVST